SVASGERLDFGGNPFENPEDRFKKDETGQTRVLKNVRSRAEARSNRPIGGEWDQYVEEAKKYYQLDASQAAVADSLLRDYKERAKVAVGGEREWQARVYRNRLWWGISITLPGQWNHPLRLLLDREAQRIDEPLAALGDELKERIEAIPTQAQREAAEQRIQLALKEKGLLFEEPAPVSTAPDATTGGEQ
ncbi:MAG: hypothetical protein WBL15_19475, partial [Phycisphaerae bacterium]